MLIELHILQNYAPSSLNCDELGSPKSCMFGGLPRGRISSQCLKRAMRDSDIMRKVFSRLGESIQTRMLPELVRKELVARGIPNEHASIAAQRVATIGSKNKDNQKGGKEKGGGSSSKKVLTSQTCVFSVLEQNLVADVLEEALQGAKDEKEAKTRVKKVKLEKEVRKRSDDSGSRVISPEIALFGRMITSDIFRTIESSVQVAHALSVNQLEMEYDYYITSDQLSNHAAMVGETEYNSNCYYKYFNLDFDSFIANLLVNTNGTKEKKVEELSFYATEVVEAFVKAAALAKGYGKQNSFAAFQPPSAILVEIKENKMPMNYANAFLSPVRARPNENLVEASINKFATFVNRISTAFGLDKKARLWFTDIPYENVKINGATECESLDGLISGIINTLTE